MPEMSNSKPPDCRARRAAVSRLWESVDLLMYLPDAPGATGDGWQSGRVSGQIHVQVIQLAMCFGALIESQ